MYLKRYTALPGVPAIVLSVPALVPAESQDSENGTAALEGPLSSNSFCIAIESVRRRFSYHCLRRKSAGNLFPVQPLRVL